MSVGFTPSFAARPLAAPARPAAPQAPLATPIARPAQAPVAPQALPGAEGLKGLLNKVATFLLHPYLAYVGKKGAEQFVLPNNKAPNGPDPSHYGLNFETLNFKSTDGTPLDGWYIPAAAPSDKTIVIVHGHGDNMSKFMPQFAPWLHQAGYNVLCFDCRDTGGSGGTQNTMGYDERRDLNAAITQAQAKGAKNIAVMGVSEGAATAISEAADDPRVKAVVADCPYDTIYDAVAPRLAAATQKIGPFNIHYPFNSLASQAIIQASDQDTGRDIAAAEPARNIAKLGNRPLFLIHGQADDETPPSCSQNLQKADPAAQLWLVPGAKHAQSYQTAPQQYQAKVLSFLQGSV